MELAPHDVVCGKDTLGRGSRFVVYEARFRGRPAALKTADLAADGVRDSESAVREARRALEREYAALERLAHPHIVRAHGLWRSPENHRMHLVLEQFSDATTLAQVIAVCQAKRSYYGARVWDAATQEIVRQVGDALEHAHARGVQHNDLKPDNVLVRLTPGGEIDTRLIDFEATGVDNERGRFEYAAPERIDGGPATPRSDVYSFAALVFKLLSGTLPYRQEDLESSRRARETPIDAATDEVPKRAWDWIVADSPAVAEALKRALDVNPERRPRSIRAFLASLPFDAKRAVRGGAGDGGLRLGYLVTALAALAAVLALNLPLHDSTLRQRTLARPPAAACNERLTPLAVDVCRRIAPSEADCLRALTLLTAPQECPRRLGTLAACGGGAP